MKKYLFPVVLTCMFTMECGFASEENRYVGYYQGRHLAELSIIAYRMKDALHIYDSLFLLYPRIFTNDLYNASICAIYENDIPKLMAYTKQFLAQSSENILLIYEIVPGFKTIQSSKKWKQFIEKEKPFINSIKLTQDSAILIRFAKIMEREQNQRKENGEILSDREIDELFLESCEELLSLFDVKGDSLMSYYYTMPQGRFMAILLHYYSMRQKCIEGMYPDFPVEKVLMLDSLLVHSVHQGYFDPYDYMNCADVFATSTPCMVNFHVNLDSASVTTWLPDDSSCNENNLKRINLGIPSIEEDAKKIRERIVFKTENYPFQAIKDTAATLRILLNKGEIDSNDMVVYYTLGILDLEKKYTAELERQMLPCIRKAIVREGKEIESSNNDKGLFFFRFPKSGWKTWYVGKEY